MLWLYRIITSISAPLLGVLLNARVKRGKEDAARLYERKGQPSLKRPSGKVLWLHAASVGEAQSALILITKILSRSPNIHVLVTTGTRTSAQIMAQRLPNNAFHQYYPLDHPKWCADFLGHWKPDYILWMESEFWPNMLAQVKGRKIPSILLNARLSDKSYAKWKRFPKTMRTLLSSFTLILTQSQKDTSAFESFGHNAVQTTDNIKYAAAPLPVPADDLLALTTAIGARPMWVYASTHAGEEDIAAKIHAALKTQFPALLTILVPRHPERRDAIARDLSAYNLNCVFRGNKKALPDADCDIYIADTLGELGLFYHLCPIAMIGRSLSNDGGGGHNPIEAAQTGCAIITGPNHQFQIALFNALQNRDAVKIVSSREALQDMLKGLLSNPDEVKILSQNAKAFTDHKIRVIDDIFTCIKNRFSL